MGPTQKRGSAAVSDIRCRVGDKWSVAILQRLENGALRFGELKRAMKAVSQRMLTHTLKGLERDGLLLRTLTPTVPPRVDYELTDLGRDLLTPVTALDEWSDRNRASIQRARRRFDDAQGR